MSKSNMLLGLAKGKVGDLVFYRDGGEQRTRTRVIPKNPRTIAQMAQRVKIANVSGLYRAAAGIFADSFSNRPSNQSGYNVFASVAIAHAPYLTKEQAAAAAVLPQPAMVSRGVLPSLEYRAVASDDVSLMGLAIAGADEVAATVGGYSTAIKNSYPSVMDGDELTFVTLKFTPADDSDLNVDVYRISTIVGSLKVDVEDSRDLENLGFVISDDAIGFAGGASLKSTDIVMQFVIHSRVSSGGKLDVSTQFAYLSSTAQALYDDCRTAQALNDAVESYRASATPLLR